MGRIEELDALRGAAAVVVVAFHIGALHDAFPVPYGWTAVDLFFVLSGYLITAILLRHRPTAGFFASFYARRGLRIWPIYYLSLLGLVAVNPLLPHPYPLDGMPGYFTYTQASSLYGSDAGPPSHRALDHTWTLAIEEQFYLIWPALVSLAGRRRFVALAMAVVVASTAARLAGLREFVLLSRSDGFALGGILAYLFDDREWAARHLPRLRAGFGLAGAASALALGWFAVLSPSTLRRWGDPYSSSVLIGAFTVGYFALVGLILCDAGRRWLAPLRVGWLGSLGRISYGLYLYHAIIQVLVDDVAQSRGIRYPAWLQAAIFGASVAAAALSWRFVERPILAWKDRFPYGGPVEPAPAPTLLASRAS